MSKEALFSHYFSLQRLAGEGKPVDDALLETEQELYEEVEDEIDQTQLDAKRAGWNRFWGEMAEKANWDDQLKRVL